MLFKCYTRICLACILFIVKSINANNLREPVVLLNGLAGASFNARLTGSKEPHWICKTNTKGEWYSIWLSLHHLLPENIDCFFHNIVLQYDENTKEYHNADNVDIDGSINWGGVKGIEYLDPGLKKVEYYHELISLLTKTYGYEVGKTLLGAPYDWRLAADGLSVMKTFSGNNSLPYYKKLQLLIENAYENNNKQRVHIISHSMGGPVALHFLHQQTRQWKDKYIASFIPTSPPFGGSVNTIRAMLSGDNFDAPIVKESIFWPVQSTCASGPWLFPQGDLWGKDEIVVRTPTKNYTSSDWVDLLSDLPALSNAKKFTIDHNLLKLTLGEDEFKSPGVNTHVLRGGDVKTQNGYIYDVNFKDVGAGKPAPPPVTVFNEYDGDGTVPNRSLARALVWEKELVDNGYNFTYNVFSGATHIGILSNADALHKIAELLGL